MFISLIIVVQVWNLHTRYVGVIWFPFCILQLLHIRFTTSSRLHLQTCDKTSTKQWIENWTSLDLVMVFTNARTFVTSLIEYIPYVLSIVFAIIECKAIRTYFRKQNQLFVKLTCLYDVCSLILTEPIRYSLWLSKVTRLL